ncbi:cytochrome P450 monooxygenase [Coccidioides immitis H538.4]|uniref:Cytochrome P450 monooxygenase n=1 Tax=Coccidioides immitis H538.4 TaxID=396776 RepID=A0A0J8S687_COCIT|nr:cytochrome P450 monooxygenase [Coccidioides immitis H538.4]
MSYVVDTLTYGGLIWAAYLAGLVIYRLYFHPLAKFPGPRYAALSRWHEIYYDVYLGGKFIFHIEDLHKKYGPIVRIAPDELHVIDSDFFDTIFTKAGRVDKYEWLSNRFGNATSTLTTAPDSLHKLRRGALNPFFSRKRIINLQELVREKIAILVGKINEYKESGAPMTISRGYMALVEDIIMQYCFARDYNHLETPNWKPIFHDPLMAISMSGNAALHFPLVPKIMECLPQSWVVKLNPLYVPIFRLQNDLSQQIRNLKEDKVDAKDGRATVFFELIHGDLPASEKEDRRVRDEAQLIIGAGLVTTSWALSVGTFFLLSNPEALAKLRRELGEAIREDKYSKTLLQWAELEKLPFLTAVIKESIRLSYGTSSRNVRLSPNSLKYKDWVIPARTPVSMTIPFLNHDEEIFPDSHAFNPERWLNSPKTSNGSNLDRYFVGFGKGTRSCLGSNLAWCELYLIFATIFRYFDFELYKTDKSDVELVHDYFLPFPKLDTKGIRVRVKQ